MNDPKTTTPTPASAGQMAQAGFMIARASIGVFESSNISSDVLTNLSEEDVKNISSKIVREILNLTEEKWFVEKKKISLFFKKFFKIDIDWSKVTIPSLDAKLKRIEYCPAGLTEDQIFEAYSNLFGNTYKNWTSITKAIKSQ